MNKNNYLSVGIDVGSAFRFMSIVDPQERVVLKPFKIIHNNPDSLERAASAIKTALHTVFPQYLAIFSNILGKTSKMILR